MTSTETRPLNGAPLNGADVQPARDVTYVGANMPTEYDPRHTAGSLFNDEEADPPFFYFNSIPEAWVRSFLPLLRSAQVLIPTLRRETPLWCSGGSAPGPFPEWVCSARPTLSSGLFLAASDIACRESLPQLQTPSAVLAISAPSSHTSTRSAGASTRRAAPSTPPARLATCRLLASSLACCHWGT